MKTLIIIIISVTIFELILITSLYIVHRIRERKKRILSIIKRRCKWLYERGDIRSLDSFFEQYMFFIIELPKSFYDKDKDKDLISFLIEISRSGYVLDKYSDDDLERYCSFGEIRKRDKEELKKLFINSAV